jgi:hypothetical protein
MNQLVNLTFIASLFTARLAHAIEQRVQDFVLNDHTVYAVPVSTTRVTTISFPSPIAAIDAALTTLDGKTPGVVQVAHTKGTAYFSARALSKNAATNINVRWNNRTYVFELRESAEPFYSVLLKSPIEAGKRPARPLTPPRLLGLLDKAKAFVLLKTYHPEAVADVEHRDLREKPSVSDCGDYEVRLTEAVRFPDQDTLVFQLVVNNRSDKPLEHAPERLEVRVGERVFTPALTDLSSIVAPHGAASGYVAISGGTGDERNDLSLKNDFTFVLSRRDREVEAAVRDFKAIDSSEILK